MRSAPEALIGRARRRMPPARMAVRRRPLPRLDGGLPPTVIEADPRPLQPTSAGSSKARRLLAVAPVLGAGLAALVALTAGSDAARHTARSSPSRSTHATAVVAGASEPVRDPEESKSFPVSPSVHHAAASTPAAAGEAVVAHGALSDAEVRKALAQEERAAAADRAMLRAVRTPAPGGDSVGGNGTIPIPTNVPEVIQRVIAGGNAIADFPYIWGGGHGSFVANGYDCSGSVSYALAAGGLLSEPLVSGDLARWGDPGPGRWITIYANAGHTFMSVNGVWFDTAGRSGPYASRWLVRTPSLTGYAVRHPRGL
jgi:cell wall-associated NlpC family hydrolase